MALARATLLLLLVPASGWGFEGARRARTQPEPPPGVLTRAPTLARFVEAPFPDAARQAGLSGQVGLLIDIGPDGRVLEAQVVSPAGHGFDEAALDAVRQFQFTPADIDGAPSAVRIEYLYRFEWRPPPEPAPEPEPPLTASGRVLERGRRTPVAGARVWCREHDAEAVSDADGRFLLRAPPGPCRLSVEAGGYELAERHETLEPGTVLEITWFLQPRSWGRFETVVRGARDTREVTRRVLEREQVQSMPGAFGDPIRAIQSLPGVARSPYAGADLVVRGASPSDSGAYLDGIPIPVLFHFMGGPSVINAELLDAIDFLPGGFGARFGRAVGGVLDARTRSPDRENTHGSFDIDLLDSSAFLETPVHERLSVAVAARRSYVDAVLPSISPGGGLGTVAVVPRYWDYQARADYGLPGDAHHLTVLAFGSDDELSAVTTGGTRFQDLRLGYRVSFHRVGFNWIWQSGAWTNILSPYLGRDASGMTTDSPSQAPVGSGGVSWSAGLREELTLHLEGGHALRVGLDLAGDVARITGTLPGDDRFRDFPGADPRAPLLDVDRRIVTADFATYVEAEVQATERLTLLPGLRVDHYRLDGQPRWAFDPRLSARFKLSRRTALKGSAGHYTRAPEPGALDPDFGNPALALQKAFQASLGVEQQVGPVFALELTGFFNHRYDRVVGSGGARLMPDGSVRPVFFTNDGLGRAFGLEMMLKHAVTPSFFGWVAYTLSRSEVAVRSRGGYALEANDQPHLLTAVGQYRFGRGWGLGARFRVAAGRPITPVVGADYDADADRFLARTGSGVQRQKVFHQLDLRLDKEWLFARWRLSAYLEVQNAYWARNVELVQWDYRFRERMDVPGLPLLPSLGLKGSF